MGIRIVSAGERHIEQILAIEKRCFSVPFTEEQLRSQMPDGSHVLLVAEEDGRVLGYVGLMYVLDEGYISNVAVAPEHRRRGIADMLIIELRRVCGDLKLVFMTLEVRAGNEPARSLYKKHGFTDVGRRKNYYTLPTEDAILMTSYLN
ncbi:MAG: ribosomal protein S18-alanine N-acetyltransferase [Oscillospiraceae bacterium]|nr:ribosomal protein S18-alanine N-acetyltransferase [Oscillospiraceae bacterium]